MQAGFRRLIVWQRAKALAVSIYRLSRFIAADRSLADQMRRAAVSVASNIAEGNERGSDREACRFFYIAKGSTGELSTQLEIAAEIGLLSQKEADAYIKECEEISRMLHGLIKRRGPSRLVPRPSPL